MFKWLKKAVGPSCPHGKKFGETWPPNMVEVVRFSPYKTDRIGYTVCECSDCGKRMFACIGLHLMGPATCAMIDDFIGHKVTLPDFIAFLEREMAWHKLTEKTETVGTAA